MNITPKSDMFPTIYFHAPMSGWLQFDVLYQGRTLEGYITNVYFDAFGDMLFWLESVLLGELPATWTVWEEGPCVYFTATPAANGEITLTVTADPWLFMGSERRPPHLATVTVDPKTLVHSYVRALQNMTNYRYGGGWPYDIATLDFSRIYALLAGEGDASTWREELKSGARKATLYD